MLLMLDNHRSGIIILRLISTYVKQLVLLSVITLSFLFSARDPGATFLLTPPSARATGMAYAFTAISDDVFANYYNSAGLACFVSPSIAADYCGYLTGFRHDMHYLYTAWVYPLSTSAWGGDFTFFTPGDVEVRDENGVYLGTFLAWRIAPRISYARKVIDDLSLAVSWKFVYQKYPIYSWYPPSLVRYPGLCGLEYGGTGMSWCFDINSLYRVRHNLSIGLVIHNIGPNIKYEESGVSDPLPRLARLGVMCVPVDNRYLQCTISGEITKVLVGVFADEEQTFWQELRNEFRGAWKGIGLELVFYRVLAVRGGYFYDREATREGFTYGIGVSFKGLEFGIGIDEDLYDFPTRNRTLSISYRF